MGEIAQNFIKYIGVVFSLLVFISCNENIIVEDKPIAIVEDNVLYLEEIKSILPEGLSEKDSIAFVENYINKWATQHLLMSQAKFNLSEETQERFKKMLKEYEISLYTEAYKNAVVSKQQDTTISKARIETYYEENKENFYLNNELLKIRYLSFDKSYSDKKTITEAFKSFNQEDKELLTNKTYQFIKSNLNDSVWVKKDNLLLDLAILKEKEIDLKKGDFIEIQDSLAVYLLKVSDKLNRNDIAPLSYIKPTIKEILLNIDRVNLIKKLEKDIIRDAIQNKKFQNLEP